MTTFGNALKVIYDYIIDHGTGTPIEVDQELLFSNDAKEILLALKTYLLQEISSIKKIEVIPHEEILPDAINYPFVGLKDGGSKSDNGLDPLTYYRVDIWCYVEIVKPEASIVGDAAASRIGVLELANTVLNTVLALGTLGLADVISVEADASQPPSEPGWHGDKYIQRKRVTVYYLKNE